MWYLIMARRTVEFPFFLYLLMKNYEEFHKLSEF